MIRLALLSGLLSDEAAWAPVAERLAGEAEVSILSFPRFDSLTAMAEHVLAETPGRFAVAGHSMGGRVALEVARLGADRILGLALLDSGVHPVGAQEPASRGALVDLARREGMSAVAQAWLPPMMGLNAARTTALTPELAEMVLRYDPESFAAQQRALLTRPDGAAALQGVRVPVLLMTGADDRWAPPAQHLEMQALAPASELVIVPDAGHFLPVEQPEATAEAMRRWLGRLDQG